MDANQVSAIFIAANVAEAESAERLLEREGIEYQVTPEPYLSGIVTGVCHQGLMFEVLSAQAQACRDLLTRAGLARGVVPPADV
jgi:tRNA G18 (ribose-2'-O)-methylase SpoU